MGVQAAQHERMIVEFRQRLSISVWIVARVLDKFPVHSGRADIRLTNGHPHCHESLAANPAFLRKVSRNPPIAGQTGETLQQMIPDQLPSPPDLAIVNRA